MPRKVSPQETLERTDKAPPDRMEIVGTRVSRDVWRAIAYFALEKGMEDMSSAYRMVLEDWLIHRAVTGKSLTDIKTDDLVNELDKRGFSSVEKKDVRNTLAHGKKTIKTRLEEELDHTLDTLLRIFLGEEKERNKKGSRG